MRFWSLLLLVLVGSSCQEGRIITPPVDTTSHSPNGCYLVSPSITITYYKTCPASPRGIKEWVIGGVTYKVLWDS